MPPLPNQYRPSRTNERLQPTNEDEYSGMADAYRLGWLGQLHDAFERGAETIRTGNPNYDPFDHIPEGYEAYAGAFANVRSDEGIALVRQQIDENLAVRARREARGFGSTLMSDIGAGILDPQMLIAPELRGLGLVGGAWRGGLVLGGTGATTELIRGSLDPTSTREETALGVGFSFLLGTGIGGLVGGALPAPRGAGAAAPGPADLRASESMFRGWRVISVPGDPRDGGARRHAGYDIAPPAGRPQLVADRDWEITEIGEGGRSGIFARVRFSDNSTWTLMHLRERPTQTRGTRGDIIAIAGNTGNARNTPTHFHAEGRDAAGNRLDPRQYFNMDGSGGAPRAGPADPIQTQSFLENIDPPRETDLDGRGVRVVIGPTGMVDEAGNYIPAAYVPARERPADPLSLNESPLPEPVHADRDLPLAATMEEAAPERTEMPIAAAPENLTDVPPQHAPSPQTMAAADARLTSLAESDTAFFGQLKDTDLYREAATVGLQNLSLAKRARLATALADELDGDEAALRALFGGDPPRRVTAKAIRERLNLVVKERLKLEMNGSPVRRGSIAPEAESAAPDLAQLRARMTQLRSEGMKWKELGEDAKARKAFGDADRIEEELAGSQTDTILIDGVERQVSPEPPRFDTMDEALFEMRELDFRKRVAAELREQADSATSEKVRRILMNRADQVENGEVPARGIVDNVPEPTRVEEPEPSLPARTETEPEPKPLEVEAVEQHLDEADRTELASAYGEAEWTPAAQSRFLDDLRLAATAGYEAVAENIRHVIRKVLTAIMAAAIVFSPTGLRPVSAEAGVIIARSVSLELRSEVPTEAARIMTAEARSVYEAVAPVAERTGRGFMIADKPSGQIHVFGRDGRHIASSRALYGADRGDTIIRGQRNPAGQQHTPAGRYALEFRDAPEYTGGKVASFREVDTEEHIPYEVGGVAVHSVYLGDPAQNRLGRLASDTVADNRISQGCINTTQDLFLRQILPNMDELDRGLIFVLPEDPARAAAMFPAEQTDVAVPGLAGETPTPPPKGPDIPEGLPQDQPVSRKAQAMRRQGRGTREPEEPPYTEPRQAGDDPDDEFAEQIRIDVDAIIGSFDDKPWTRPGAVGGDALPSDAFRAPHEWLNFVFLREREKVVNPQRDGETLFDYNNRINGRALEDMRAGQLPFSPERSKLEQAALAPTPIGQLMRLVPADATIMRDIQDLAGDMATTLMANRAGGAASAGGSVFQRTLRWIATTAELRLAVRQQWLRYVKGDAPPSGKMTEIEALAARVPLIGAAARKGKMTLREFRDQVGRAQISDDLDVVPEARVAARVLNHIFQRFEREARELGVFERTQNVRRMKESLTRRADALEARIAESAGIGSQLRTDLEAMVRNWRAQADELADVEAKPVMPSGESRYFPRIWNAGALRDRKDEALALLRNAYLREGSSPEKADLQAKGAYDLMIGEPNSDFLPSSPTSVRGRTVPLTNQEAVDFIITDPELVLGIYSRRTGAAIEMTRRFGDPGGLEHEDELLADLLLRGVEPKRAQKAMQVWRDARDRVAGGFHGKDPMSWDNRVARFLKNSASLAVMGKVIYSQVVDIARVIGTVGPKPLWKSLVGVMSGDLARFEVGPYAKQAGEALDLVMARTTARMIESDDAILVTRETGLERAVAGAQAPFFVANLMIPFTVIMKEWTSVAAGHVILDEARLVARAIQAGETPDAALVSRLAGVGIDQHDAQLLASMPFETTDGGLHLANVNAWEGPQGQRARDLFLGAVSGETRRGVITPGPLDKPAIMDGVFHTNRGRERGLARLEAARRAADEAYQEVRSLRQANADETAILEAVERLANARGELSMARRGLGRAGRIEAPLASLPFQLKSFVLASGGKLLHGLLSSRDRAKTAGILALMAGGVISTWLKASETNRWHFMDWPEVAFESFNNAGLGAYFTDIAEAVDNTFHVVGDDRPGINDEVGAVGGVSAGLIAGLFEAFIDDDLSDARRAAAIRRALPLNNLIWWEGRVRDLTNVMTGDDSDQLAPNGAPTVRQDLAIREMADMTETDLRTRRPDVFTGEPLPDDPMAADIDELIDALERDIAPRLRKGRTRSPAAGRRQPTRNRSLRRTAPMDPVGVR